MSTMNSLEEFSGEAARIPSTLRRELEAEAGVPLEAYARLDLDADLKSYDAWLAVAGPWLLEARPSSTRKWPLADFRKAEESEAPSLVRLLLSDAEGPRIGFRATKRHRGALARVRSLIEARIEDPRFVPSAKMKDADAGYREALLKPVLEVQSLSKGERGGVLSRLLKYVKPYRRRLLLGGVAAFGFTGLSLLPSWYTGVLLDRILKPLQENRLGIEEATRFGAWLVGALAATFLARELLAWLKLVSIAMVGEYVVRDLRRDVYAHLHKLGLAFFSKKPTGGLVSRVTSDTDRIWDFIGYGVVEVSVSCLMLVAMSVMLLCLDWRLGLVMILPVPFLLYALFWHSRRMERLFSRAWRRWSRLTALVSDALPGIRVIKAFNRSEHEVARFGAANDAAIEEFGRIHDAWTRFWPLLMMSLHLTVLAVWAFGLPRLIGTSPWGTLTPGTFVSFLMYTGLFVQPLETIGQISRVMNRATSSAQRIFEILDTDVGSDLGTGRRTAPPLQGHIRFENVSFSYDGIRRVLHGIDLEIRPGELIGLVGPSGSGKSTLVNLLARFYEADAGRILVDGQPIDELEVGSYRTQIGMVLQEPYLFHGTLLENIRYGRPEAPLAEVFAAAKAARVHDFVMRLPMGYETVIGERGHTLSGGERQRVSIARAILQNPRILILDEATSSVDVETEKAIQDALNELVRGRSVVAIAHRLSTLDRADRLVVLKNGRLVEVGTHRELLAKEGGEFKKLHDLQRRQAEIVGV